VLYSSGSVLVTRAVRGKNSKATQNLCTLKACSIKLHNQKSFQTFPKESLAVENAFLVKEILWNEAGCNDKNILVFLYVAISLIQHVASFCSCMIYGNHLGRLELYPCVYAGGGLFSPCYTVLSEYYWRMKVFSAFQQVFCAGSRKWFCISAKNAARLVTFIVM